MENRQSKTDFSQKVTKVPKTTKEESPFVSFVCFCFKSAIRNPQFAIPSMGLFAKFKEGLRKTHSKLAHEIKRIITASPKLASPRWRSWKPA